MERSEKARPVPRIAYVLLRTAIIAAISGLRHRIDLGTIARCLENALLEAEETLEEEQ